ncbi:hypothetical protein [Staphylococcus haemolyticus]|uniref:hypothetical protein n=1 Tax=Staphylococcus haemolyticus TaxID=1283 RepID=UPI002884766D|nr:hypothetical protein [Staphylococcus haemolyticus]MDT0704425.1 hypothetical protein [Staphylococcus haemolyticus]MDT0722604.1 hypothetical protein [Staphylococcus haemolyticus]
MTVKLSQKSYDGLLNDNEKLHEEIAELMVRNVNLTKRNRELKHKVQAFDEIVNAIEESANSYELVARIKLEVLKYQKLERGSDE